MMFVTFSIGGKRRIALINFARRTVAPVEPSACGALSLIGSSGAVVRLCDR